MPGKVGAYIGTEARRFFAPGVRVVGIGAVEPGGNPRTTQNSAENARTRQNTDFPRAKLARQLAVRSTVAQH